MTSDGVFFFMRQTISLRLSHSIISIGNDCVGWLLQASQTFSKRAKESERSPHAPFGSRSMPSGSDRICRFIHGRKLTVRDISFSAWFGKKHGDRVGEIYRLVRHKKTYESEVMMINCSGFAMVIQTYFSGSQSWRPTFKCPVVYR